jgi:hypothetical protein
VWDFTFLLHRRHNIFEFWFDYFLFAFPKLFIVGWLFSFSFSWNEWISNRTIFNLFYIGFLNFQSIARQLLVFLMQFVFVFHFWFAFHLPAKQDGGDGSIVVVVGFINRANRLALLLIFGNLTVTRYFRCCCRCSIDDVCWTSVSTSIC